MERNPAVMFLTMSWRRLSLSEEKSLVLVMKKIMKTLESMAVKKRVDSFILRKHSGSMGTVKMK